MPKGQSLGHNSIVEGNTPEWVVGQFQFPQVKKSLELSSVREVVPGESISGITAPELLTPCPAIQPVAWHLSVGIGIGILGFLGVVVPLVRENIGRRAGPAGRR